MNVEELNDEELQAELARLKQQFEHSAAQEDASAQTNQLYSEFVRARNEAIRRLIQRSDALPSGE
ncbi:MAG: hypothetical protein EOO08_09810 [Chitinophagaceae bacterium]|nr:MAG: hypothetical protein EOO08_09810 [Chitinophagaceae bacterium]